MPTIFIPPQLRDLSGGVLTIEAPGETVGELVDALEARFPGVKERLCADGQLHPSLQVSINDSLSARGLRAPAPPNSEVHFLPALGGG